MYIDNYTFSTAGMNKLKKKNFLRMSVHISQLFLLNDAPWKC